MLTLRWVAVLAALPLAACGSSAHRVGLPLAQVRAGKEVFTKRCTTCHSLAGIGPRRPVGDDLTGYQMSAAEIPLRARSMPPASQMNDRELRAVAAYVAYEQALAHPAR